MKREARPRVRLYSMRTLLLVSVLSASVCVAQQGPGTWGGYVSGWVTDSPRYGTFPGLDVEPRRVSLTQRQRDYLMLQQLFGQQAFFAQQNYVQLQQVSARQEELGGQQLAQQHEFAAQQRRQARDQELAAQEQLLAQQQQLAVQQQLLAQQQQQAATEELVRVAAREAKLKELEAEQKLHVEREAQRLSLARAEADARPPEKGPDIHRWVDEDDVVHYSTKPRR